MPSDSAAAPTLPSCSGPHFPSIFTLACRSPHDGTGHFHSNSASILRTAAAARRRFEGGGTECVRLDDDGLFNTEVDEDDVAPLAAAERNLDLMLLGVVS